MKRGQDGGLPVKRIAGVEFSRPVVLDDLPEEGLAVDLTADETECNAVARRLGLRGVSRFGLTGRLDRELLSGGFRLSGKVSATVTQTCVVTLEPVEAEVRAAISRGFVAAEPDEIAPEEGEIDAMAEDPPDPAPGGIADLGEVATEELALALEPYPRKAGAAWPEDGLEQGPGEPGGPFAVLRQLKH